jgi:hypothetical protein
LTPFAMTALVSLLSLKEAAMALISAALSWNQSAHGLGVCHYIPCLLGDMAGVCDAMGWKDVR